MDKTMEKKIVGIIECARSKLKYHYGIVPWWYLPAMGKQVQFGTVEHPEIPEDYNGME